MAVTWEEGGQGWVAFAALLPFFSYLWVDTAEHTAGTRSSTGNISSFGSIGNPGS